MMASLEQEHIGLINQPAHTFLQPTPAIHSSCLQLAKQFLDPIASDVTETQLLRQKLERQTRKRKRGNAANKTDPDSLLRMRALYIENFGVEQVWQQASRILEAALDEVQQALPQQEESDVSSEEAETTDGKESKMVRFEDDASGPEDPEDMDIEEDGDEAIIEEPEDLEEEDDEDEDSEVDDLDIGVDVLDNDVPQDDAQAKPFVQDAHGLNDEFFDIDQFNKTTEFLEKQDAKGDRDDGAASDEEDVDWAADPMAAGAEATLSKRKKQPQQKRRKRSKPEPEPADESDDSNTGPTFGNANLDSSSSDSDEDATAALDDPSGLADFANASDIYYKDFFVAPSKKKSSQKQSKRTGALQGDAPSRPNRSTLAREDAQASAGATAAANGEDEPSALATEVSRAMTTAHHDLFSDTDSGSGSDSQSSSHSSPSPPSHRNLSTHERRQLALRKRIRALEAESISRKPWTLVGEASTPARPLNSLLEEDLDFERAGKPVPLATEETHESIVALIKRRILARDFDEVPRRLPTELLHPPSRPAPLSDSKPAQSLAAEYEAEYLASETDGRSEKLRARHAEIEALWTAVSAQLDALANWHYKPRPAAREVDVRVHAPTISVEDARPGAAGEGAQRLAPQELYDPKKGADKERDEGQVRTRGGGVLAREEEGRDARKRRRRRVKERLRKGDVKGAASGAAVEGDGRAAAKTANAAARDARGAGRPAKNVPGAEVLAQLKRGGVKVIDRKGVVRDVDGAAVAKATTGAGAGAFLL